MVQITNNHQSWPSLQLTPLNKNQLVTANHRPGKPDMLFKHTHTRPDVLSQHTKCRQAIPACLANVIVENGWQEPRTVGKLWGSEEPNIEDQQSQHYNPKEARQGIRHEA